MTLCAIGPFASSYTVDFDQLTQAGLFLLEGPTGAGKSSIIDAVVFALYGKVAARNASDDRMYSDFADPDVEPSVQLDFSTSSGMYRVRRTPKYARPKRRSSGTTTQHATARLWQLRGVDDPEPLTVSTRVDETSLQVQHLVGLSREQFVQTMVLPQGEFANFLRAPVDERRELLQRLFGTEFYDRVEDQLEELRRDASRNLQAAASAVAERLAVFAASLDADAALDEQLTTAGSTDDSLTTLADTAVVALEATADQLAEGAREASDAAQQARLSLDTGRQLEGLRRRRVDLQEQFERLMRAEDDVARARSRLDAAIRAEAVRPAADLAVAAEAAVGDAAEALTTATTALPADLRGHSLPQLQQAEREVRDTLVVLSEAVRREGQLPRARQEAAQAEEACRAAHERRDAIRAALEDLPQQARGLRERREAVQRAATRIDEVRGQLVEVQRARDAANRLVQLTVRRDSARADVKAATTAALLAQDKEHELRSRYLHGIAADLAGQLAVGDPCQVCGSCSHPRPARPSADAVERHVVDEAEANRVQAVADRDVAMQVLADFDRDWAATDVATRGLSLAAAQTRMAGLEQDLAECQQASAKVDELDEQLHRLDSDEAAMRSELGRVEDQFSAAQAHSQRCSSVLRDHLAVVTAARGQSATVEGRLALLTERADSLTGAVDARRNHESAVVALERANAEVVRCSREQQFDDPHQAMQALLGQRERERLEQLVYTHHAELQQVQGGLESPEVAAIDVDTPIDLAELETALVHADQQAQQATRSATVAEQRLADARLRWSEVLAALKEQRTVQEASAPVLRMANLATANGPDNARAMTLSTFVLVERFRDVVLAANDRLLTMSEGRYSLLHTEERVGNRRAGLGLVVFDAYTNQRRDAGTLSGGETFYCSLALALGLADVVSGESGGIALGTLFIDEGFGSLDADTLDNVMDVLSDLSATGRAVGVVSHVPELKERIRDTVVVSRLSDGSSCLQAVV